VSRLPGVAVPALPAHARTPKRPSGTHEGVVLSERTRGLGAPLSDRGELGASQFRINQEAKRIQELALLHQPHQHRLPKLS
jgi:hypothetical protein